MSVPTPSAGVIHDIGYRHYDGERRGRAYIRRSLYVDSLKGAYGLGRSARSKVMPMILFAVMCLPAGVIVTITAVTNANELVGEYPSYLLNLQLVMLIFVASQAPVTVSRDLRFRVMSLYLSRPLERVDYVIAKYAAMTSALLVLTATPLTIMFVGALVVGLPITEQIPDYLRAMAGAVLISLMLGGIGLVIAAITPRRGFAVAAIITVLLVLAGVQGILQEIATAEGLDIAPYLGLLSPFTLVMGVQDSLLGAASPLPSPPGATGALAFSAATLLIVAGSYAILQLRYRSVSVS
jgi:ABC-2 type transport system permease protein